MRFNLLWNKMALPIKSFIAIFLCVPVETTFPSGLHEGIFAPCPSSPNCISTLSSDPDKHMAPLPYADSREESRRIILSIIKSMPRTKVVAEGENYIHAEFRTLVFRFIDDVEFSFDEVEHVIHFRSASRTGHSDLGVNRRRMQKISKRYLEAIKQQ